MEFTNQEVQDQNTTMRVQHRVRESIRYWERGRILYNAVLAVIVFAFWGIDMIMAGPGQWLAALLVLVMFAVIANSLYCVAYLVDFACQFVCSSSMLQKVRLGTLISGIILAVGLELWVILQPGMG